MWAYCDDFFFLADKAANPDEAGDKAGEISKQPAQASDDLPLEVPEEAAAAASVPEPVPEVPAATEHVGPVAAAVEPAASAAVEPAASAAVELSDVVAPPVRAAAPPAAPAGPSPSQVLEFPHSSGPASPPFPHSPYRTHIICHLFCFMFVENAHFRSLPYWGGGGLDKGHL